MRTLSFLQISILLLGIAIAQTCDRCVCPCTVTFCKSVSSKTWVSPLSYSSYGYTKLVLSNDGSSCRPCPYNCKVCANENSSSCTACMPEFYNGTDGCKLCPNFCTTCRVINNITTCTQCSAGTYLDTASGLCRNCPNGAATCDNIQITTCLVGYYLVSPIVCLPCVANCQQCSTADCFLCNQGYYKNASGGCQQCNSSLNCQGCTSLASCSSCPSGYYLTTTSPRKCLTCSANCSTCTSSACTLCVPGYYLSSGSCQKALTIEKCQAYNSQSVCSACANGYYLANGQCLPCSSNCLTCSGSSFGSCMTCQTGFTLYNLMCLPVNYLTSKSYQLYYHLPGFANMFSGGSLATCVESVYSGNSISLTLKDLASSSISVTWKLYILDSVSPTTYTVTQNTQPSISYSATSALSNICGSSGSELYHVQTTTFKNIESSNALVFASTSTLAIAQINIICVRCTSLCAVCTQTLCMKCILQALLTQEDSCVYSCSTSYYTYSGNKTCLTLCPATTYSVQSNLSCLACVSPCLTCNSSISCLSCVKGYYLYQAQCQTTCPSFYYPNNLSLTCEKCVGRCLTCTSQTACLSCQVGFLHQTSCVDNCSSLLPGYYSDMNTLACQACAVTCLNCVNLATKCTSCPTTLPYLLNDTCHSACPTSTYSLNGTCKDCSYPCVNCIGSATNCTSCSINYLYGGQCLAVCPDGFYEETKNMSCVSCFIGCKLCAYGPTFCQSCNAGYYYFNSSCLSSCPPGYYANGTTCQRCINPCLTCNSSAFCLSCISNFLNATTGQCVGQSQCSSGYYAEILTLSCTVCSSACLRCSVSAALCTACSSPLLLSSSSCLATCPSGFYPSSQLSKCLPCRQPCLTCSNSSACLSCVSGYLYSNSSQQCLSYCLAGEFIDNGKCTSCGQGCLSCKSLNSCEQCASGGYLYPLSGQCVSNCSQLNQSYFGDSTTSKCLTCIEPCLTCTSVVDCSSCISGVLNQKRCVGSCPIGTYTQNSVCENCSSGCFSCVGEATNCTSCLGSYLYVGTCVGTCPEGYYPENVLLVCQQCSYKCSKCINYTYCQKCKQGYLDDTNNCIDTCSYGYFANSANRTCSPCDSQCSSCSGSGSNCVSCSSGYFLNQLTLTQSVCTAQCLSTQYNASGVCYSCSSPCLSCTSASQCVTCIVGTVLLGTSCVSSCPISTFEDNGKCSKCDASCGTCLNTSYCLTCSNSSQYAYLGNCTSQCPNLFYGDTSTKLCVQCIAPCLACSDKFVCLSCTQGYLMKGYCYDVCPPGTFSSNQTCEACQAPCSTCVFRADFCVKCVSGYYIYNGTCQKSCPSGTYINSGVCETCPYPCLKCINQVVCTSCFGGYLSYLNATCISGPTCPNDMYNIDGVACIKASDCPSNYFKDNQAFTCSSKCNLGKYTFMDNSSCLNSCPIGYFTGVDLICKKLQELGGRSLLGSIGISFIKSSRLYIELLFNESVKWNYPVSTSSYTLTPSLVIITTSRRLLASNLKYILTQSNNRIELPEPVSSPWLSVTIPAYYVSSESSSLPLQTPTISTAPHSFQKYTLDQELTGSIIYQISQSLTIVLIIVSVGFIWLNRLSDVYIIWDITQLIYLLIFLDVQYPPNLNEFILGLKNTHLYMFPNIAKMPQVRQNSTSAYYAYSYDVNFLRSAGHNVVIAIVVLGLYLILKLLQVLTNKVEKLAKCQKLKRFVYKGILRYRWHYTNDFFFLTFVSVMSFAVAQFQDTNPNYPLFGLTIALIVMSFICYIGFPIFVATKLYRHFKNISRGKMIENLKCFYRGIQKTNKFGVSLILLRYLRKLTFCVCLPTLSSRPLFVLPILTMCSLLVGLFVFIHRPFKKRMSNIVNIATQFLIVALFLIISVMQFTDEMQWLLGWIAVAILVVVVFGQMFYIFCKTLFYFEPERPAEGNIFKKSKQEMRRLAEEFFNKMFPNLKRNFSLDSSDEEDNLPAEEGDSQNSQNNQFFRQAMSIQEEVSSNPEHFQHYQPSQGASVKAKEQPVPKYLIRCVHTLDNKAS